MPDCWRRLIPLLSLLAGCSAPSRVAVEVPSPAPTTPAASSNWTPPEPHRLVADLDGIRLLLPDGTIRRWSDAGRPVVAPAIERMVGFVVGGDERVPTTLTEDGVFDGIVPAPCRTWAVPPNTRQVVRVRGIVALDRDGTLWHGRGSTSPLPRCSDSAPASTPLAYRRVPTTRRVREVFPASGAACVVDELGEISCIDFRERPADPWPFPQSAPAMDVVGGDIVCMIDALRSLTCAAPWRDGHFVNPGPERFVALDAALSGFCALTTTREVRCFRTTTREGEPTLKTVDIGFGDARLPDGREFTAHDGTWTMRACVVSEMNEVVCLASDRDRRATDPTNDTPPPTLTTLESLEDLQGAMLVARDSSATMSCTADADGRIRCWRFGPPTSHGRGGLEDSFELDAPAAVRDVLVEGRELCVVLTDGSLQCATSDRDAQAPGRWQRVADQIRAAGRGDGFLCFVSGSSGALRCRGRLELRATGRTLAFDPDEPVRWADGRAAEVETLAVGTHHLCAVVRDGSVACLGDGTGGQLGASARNLEALGLTPVPGIAEVDALVAGHDFTCATRHSGIVHCWGDGVAYHPVRLDGFEGVRVVVDELIPGRFRRCSLGRELECGDAGRTLLAPWETRPRMELDATGDPVGYEWNPGSTRLLCERPTVRSSGDVTTCYTDAPIAAEHHGDPDPPHGDSLAPTLEDFPPFPMIRPASARMYAYGNADADSGGCDNPSVSRSRAGSEDCSDLARRGRLLPRRDLNALLEAINSVAAYGHRGHSLCWDPHHEIRFFDARRRVIGRIEVCLTCDQMRGDPPIPAQQVAASGAFPDGIDFRGLCRQLRLPGCERGR